VLASLAAERREAAEKIDNEDGEFHCLAIDICSDIDLKYVANKSETQSNNYTNLKEK